MDHTQTEVRQRSQTIEQPIQMLNASAMGGEGGEQKGHAVHKLGTLKGVMIPTCENMWGVIIFLRFYVIVGHAGLGYSLLIITLSFMVALFTALSLSAIATCGTSHGLTGVYAMLARALGKEIATATGLVYFLGIVFLSVLECLGACEELFHIFPRTKDYPVQLWGSIFMAGLSLLVGGGIKLVSKIGLAAFVVALLTFLGFYVSLLSAPNLTAVDGEYLDSSSSSSSSSSGSDGGRMLAAAGGYARPSGISSGADNLAENWGPHFTSEYGFSECLSLFFPCFTGILSGANRAPTLKDPSVAIPNGTLGAIIISYFMYTSYFVLWAAVGDNAFLTRDEGQVNAIFWPSITAAQIGIIVASLGQAMQCIVVAPRLLASIAADDMMRLHLPRGVVLTLKPFARMHGGEPKRALCFTYLFGGAFVLLGSLDVVAPLLSMCFLLCYASMNLNCFVLDILKDPHWRPRWRFFHWSCGLVGFLLCCTLMFIINWYFALAAWALALGILALIVKSSAETDWGSALHGLRFQIATKSLLAIDMEQHLDANWQPQMLLLYQLREDVAIDTTGDGRIDTVALDTTGDGQIDTVRPLTDPASASAAPAPAAAAEPPPMVGTVEMSDELPQRAAPFVDTTLGAPATAAPVGATLLDEVVEAMMAAQEPSAAEESPPVPSSVATAVTREAAPAGHTHELMMSVADQLRHGSGLIIAAAIIQLDPDKHKDDDEAVRSAEAERLEMHRQMKAIGVKGFCMTVLAHNTSEGKSHAMQCAGLGPLSPNTIVMGWPWWWRSNPKRCVREFLSIIKQATLRRKALLCCHNLADFPTNDQPQSGYIDVWWIKHDGGLLLLMAHLLRKHRVWRRCALRLHLITETGTDRAALRERIHTLLARINIEASVEEVIEVEPSSLLPYMQEERTHGWQLRHAEQVHAQRRASAQKGGRRDVHRHNPLSTIDQLLDDPHLDHHPHTRGERDLLHLPRGREAREAPGSGVGSGGGGFGGGGGEPGSGGAGARRRKTKELAGAPASAPTAGHRGSQLLRSAFRTGGGGGGGGGGVAQEVGLVVPGVVEHSSTPLSPPPSPPWQDLEAGPEENEPFTEWTGDADIDAAVGRFVARRRLPANATTELLQLAVSAALVDRGGTAAAELPSPPPSPPSVATDEAPPNPSLSNSPSSRLEPLEVTTSAPPSPSLASTTLADANTNAKSAKPPSSPAATATAGNNNKQQQQPSPSSRGLIKPSTSATRLMEGIRALPAAVSKSFELSGAKGVANDAAGGVGAGAGGGAESPALVGGPSEALADFIARHGLPADAAAELNQIFESVTRQANQSISTPFMWDDIHKLIMERSAGSSLIIINLPDPPVVTPVPGMSDADAKDVYHQTIIAYMEYMEGLAESLPRVLYVHGAGQEVIQFD